MTAAGRRHRGWAAVGLAAGLVVALTAVLVAPELDGDGGLVAGQPSPGDIVAPRPVTYESRILTERARAAAERSVAPVYGQRERTVAEEQRSRANDVLQYVTIVLSNPHADPSTQRADITAVPELARLPARQIDQLLALEPEGLARVADEVGRLVRLKLRSTVTPSEVPVPPAGLIDSVDATMDAPVAELVAHLASAFIVPNTMADEALTAAARQAAREAVEPQTVAYSAGQIIVRAGDPLREEHLEALAELGLLQSPFSWPAVAGLAALLTALVATAAGVLQRLTPGFYVRTRPLAVAAGLIVLVAAAASIAVPGRPLLAFGFPAAAVAMIIAVVLGMEAGLVAGAIMAVVVGLTGRPDLELTVFVLLGSSAGAVVLGRIERFSAFLVAALAVTASDLAVIAGFRLAGPGVDLQAASELSATALANGALSSGLSAVVILAAGSLFGVTTSVQLLELARPDHPLLRQLQLKAPGTYQHSILLGNLAEAAAAEIGADVLLVRVAAYYHDIGKTVRPQFFIENQLPGQNPHDQLDPESSARVLIAHILDGEQLARRHRLPDAIVAAILEHHGTLRAEYFYRQAVADADGAAVDASHYTYPGPRPRSRETAILMLADASEAAVRAASPRTSDEMDAVIERIFADRVAEGQLDESDLTLRDLKRVRSVFVSVLQSVYHPRIRYPEGVEPPGKKQPATPSASGPRA